MRTCFHFSNVTDAKGIELIWKAIFKFTFAKMTQTKTKTCDQFDFFWIMTTKYTVCKGLNWKTSLNSVLDEEIEVLSLSLLENPNIFGSDSNWLKVIET